MGKRIYRRSDVKLLFILQAHTDTYLLLARLVSEPGSGTGLEVFTADIVFL